MKSIKAKNTTSADPMEISQRPFLFGMENKLISEEELYFDNENFYAVSKDSKSTVFKLTDIVELAKSEVQINNRRVWEIKIRAKY